MLRNHTGSVAAKGRLDFSRPFLPEPLAGTAGLGFLAPAERLVLNQIRGHGYLAMFGLDGAYADEFPFPCEVTPWIREIADRIAARPTLSGVLAALHIEWMTQRHHLEVVRNGADLDPRMRSLLHHHWLENDRSRRLSAAKEAAVGAAPRAARDALDGYLAVCAFVDRCLLDQVELDLGTLARAAGRHLDDDERDRTRRAQRRAQRWTWLGAGMTHPRFVAGLEPRHRRRVADVAAAYC